MPTPIHGRLRSVIAEIAHSGHANQTRLTILKKWFERPGRLPRFGLWMASRALAGEEAAAGDAAALYAEARRLLTDEQTPEGPDRQRAAALLERLRAFQNVFQRQQWGPVRIIDDWDLLLIEQGLALYLRQAPRPADGYTLAADYCAHYDSRYGTDLNGPAAERIEAIVRFIIATEAREQG
jgi:hypothetical protein